MCSLPFDHLTYFISTSTHMFDIQLHLQSVWTNIIYSQLLGIKHTIATSDFEALLQTS